MKHFRMITLLFCSLAALFLLAPVSQAEPLQRKDFNPKHLLPVTTDIPVRLSFNITPNPSYFWNAMMSEDGNLSYAGLPKKIEVHVGIGGPVYTIFNHTPLPYTITTNDYKLKPGSNTLVSVIVLSENNYTVARKLYNVTVTESPYGITLIGPSQPLVYKPVFNP